MDVVAVETLTIFLVESFLQAFFCLGDGFFSFFHSDKLHVLDLDDGSNARHLVKFQVLPDVLADEQHGSFAVVDDVLGIGGIELLQDGNDDGTVCDGGHEGGYPVGDILANQGNAVALFHPAALKEHVKFGDVAGKVAIGQSLASIIVGQHGQFPIVDETALINLDKVFLHHSVKRVY